MVVQNIKKFLNQYSHKKESGLSGVDFALYFVVLIIIIVLFRFLQVRTDIYDVEHVLENGMHIAQKSALTVNYTGIGEHSELQKLRIINACEDWTTNESDVSNNEERAQVKKVANHFVDYLAEEYGLVNNTTPTTSSLVNLFGENSKLHVDKLLIYEPQYEVKVNTAITEEGVINPYDNEPVPDLIIKNPFYIDFPATTYAVYEVHFNDSNEIIGSISKHIESSPTLQNGDAIEGATIESNVSIEIYGVNNIFTNVSTGASDETLKNTPIFNNNPEAFSQVIHVTESVDIVPADYDSRKR